jgi:hypothetical protein
VAVPVCACWKWLNIVDELYPVRTVVDDVKEGYEIMSSSGKSGLKVLDAA